MEKKYVVPNTICGTEIKELRESLNLTQAAFATLCNVSVNTVEQWEVKIGPIKGTICSFVQALKIKRSLSEQLKLPVRQGTLRIYYMYQSFICTVIDVDEREKDIFVTNYVGDYIYQAFGNIQAPKYHDYLQFLESRCFPESRDQMKLVLKDLNIPFYDPILIIEKTEGRMSEDNFWIKIER